MAGVALLAGLVGRLAAGLAFGVVLLYVMVYTPLKTRSTFCTLAGAACGAMPPLIGWAAASGHLPGRAWLLAGILFVWQIPHFFALAWMHRADYERGGFRMLPVVERDGALTFRVLLLFTLVLLPLGLCVTLAGLAGPIFAVGSFVLGGGWLALAVRLYQQRSTTSARRVFWASLLYLPLLLGLMLADRGPPVSGPSGLDPASRPAGAAVSATAEAGGS
jgi:protoheme IX farnesyltransferase